MKVEVTTKEKFTSWRIYYKGGRVEYETTKPMTTDECLKHFKGSVAVLAYRGQEEVIIPEGYSNDMEGKLEWLLATHYNLFHADMINRAMHDDSVSVQDFIHGCVSIAFAERETDNDEFTPKEFTNV